MHRAGRNDEDDTGPAAIEGHISSVKGISRGWLLTDFVLARCLPVGREVRCEGVVTGRLVAYSTEGGGDKEVGEGQFIAEDGRAGEC